MSDSAAAIKRTGDMLCNGWKMTSQGCPICHNALLQKQEKPQTINGINVCFSLSEKQYSHHAKREM